MNGQMTLFDYTREQVKIDTPIRLIELFAGYGSQAMALRNIGADFEHYRVVEFDKYAMDSYNAIHGTNFDPTDINDVKGVDMGIEDKTRFTYLLTYLLTHSRVPIFQSPDAWQVWQKIREHDHPFYGRSNGFLKN